MFVTVTRCMFDPVASPQLSDAISIIGREDFPQKWPDLLTEMVTRFQSGDFHIINGVLRTAHSLFKRYVWNFLHMVKGTSLKLDTVIKEDLAKKSCLVLEVFN